MFMELYNSSRHFQCLALLLSYTNVVGFGICMGQFSKSLWPKSDNNGKINRRQAE